MAVAEVQNSNLAKSYTLDPDERLALLVLEGVDIETSARLGAIVGGCASYDIKRLTEYGRYLGKAIRLREDLECSLNLTLELADKIRRGAYPYPLAWALAKSGHPENLPNEVMGTGRVETDDIQHLISLLFDSGAVDHTRHLVKEAAQNSISALSKIEGGETKDALLTLALAQNRLLLRSLIPRDSGAL
jgi:geranylgeranyl pyrophosphate synthase